MLGAHQYRIHQRNHIYVPQIKTSGAFSPWKVYAKDTSNSCRVTYKSCGKFIRINDNRLISFDEIKEENSQTQLKPLLKVMGIKTRLHCFAQRNSKNMIIK